MELVWVEELGIADLRIVEGEGGADLEIRYHPDADPLNWSREVELRVLTALGLKWKVWRLGAGRLVRASDGSLVELVKLSRRTEGE